MQLTAAFLLAVSQCVGASAAKVTPIQKVIQLMTEMKIKAEEEKQTETVAFTAFAQWCKDTQAEKTEAIKQGADTITQLEADITKAEADVAKFGSEIEELDGDLDTWNGDMAAAKAHRKKEEDTYKAAHEDLSESVDAIGRAIEVLKQRSGNVEQAPEKTDDSLLQRVSELQGVPPKARGVLTAFLERSAEGSSAPEANAYESQSGSVVGMLESLKIEFEDERSALEKDEISRRSAHELQMQDTADNVREAERQRAKKAAKKGERAEDAAQGKADLATAQRVKKDDEVFLDDTVVTCKQTATDYEQRQTLRQEELEAIQKAIEIISSGDVSGAGEKHLPQFVQQVQSTSLSQLRSSAAPSRIQLKAADFFLQRATAAKSEMLAELSAQVTSDPFAKITGMIKDMIAKLIEEAAAEATHKAWCDEELATNKQTRDDKSQVVEDLTAKIEELTALKGKLQEGIEDLHDAIGVLTGEMKERTKQREEEKAENTVTIQEAEAAKTAVDAATKVLSEFYAKASEATALLQQPGQTASQAAGKVFNKPYKGLAGASGGVMGMLEVIASDFARLLAETESAESTALREYKAFMHASKEDKAAKEKDARQHGFELTRAKHGIKQNTKELEGTQEELDAALAYFEKLRPTCLPEPPAYAERKAKREEEIQSLKEGLAILNQQDLA